MAKRPTFEQACAQYVHRFTMEHVPDWAGTRALHNQHYAPAYRSDREWYDNTYFPGEPGHIGVGSDSRNQTWPLGQWLVAPYRKGAANAPAAPQATGSRWTPVDQRQALDDGWGIFDNSDHGLRIERHDMMPRFDSDAAAQAYVASRAINGDALCRRAWIELATHHAVSLFAADAAEPDYVALARDAGYDGSPGGEREWCIGNGMVPKVEE